MCVCVCAQENTHDCTAGVCRRTESREIDDDDAMLLLLLLFTQKRARRYKAYICKLRYRRHSTRRRDRFAHADFLRAWNQGTTTLLERTKSVAKKTATTLNEEKNINKIVRAPLHLAGKIHIFRQSVRVCEVLLLSGVGWFLGMMIKGRLGKNQTRKNH